MLRTESRPNFPRRQPFGLGMTARVLSSCAALMLAVGLMAPQSAHAQEDSPWHAALDVAYVRSSLHFRSIAPVLPDCTEDCQPKALRSRQLRGTFAFGLAGLSVEASLARPVSGDAGDFDYSLGVHLDTSFRAHVSLGIRGAYLRRFGRAPGRGGRLAASLQIRLVQAFVLYGEAGLDVTSVSQNMSDNGVVLAYGTQLALGLRVSFAP